MNRSHKKQNDNITQSEYTFSKGYTLPELLIVVAIIVVAVAMIFLYLDPVKRLQQSRNVRRIADSEAIADAIALSKLDDPDTFYNFVFPSPYNIITRSTNGSCTQTCTAKQEANTNCLVINSLTDNYLPEIPLDPMVGDELLDITGYYVSYVDKKIIVGACQTELGLENELPTIEVIR